MRRILTALILGLMLTGLVAVPAMAAPPSPCVPGVTVSTFTDSDTGNVIQVTTTTTCNDDGTVDDISYEYETLMYWVKSKRDGRAGGHYETPAERLTPPGPFRVCGPARAWNVCS